MPSPRTGFSSIKHGRVVRYIFYRKTSDVEKAARVLESRGLRVADQGPNFVSYYGTPSKREVAMLARHEDVTQYNPKYRQIATAAFRRRFESCVMQVKASGSAVSPWAVCTTTLKGYPKRNPVYSLKGAHITPIRRMAASVGGPSRTVTIWDADTGKGIKLSGGDIGTLLVSIVSQSSDDPQERIRLLRSPVVERIHSWWIR